MLQLAKVLASHPEGPSVDIVFMADGRQMAGVPVLSAMAGGNVGHVDLPSPELSSGDNTVRNSGTRDIFAVVGQVGSKPVVIGFMFPQVAQCLFADKDRMVYRHSSDVYMTIDKSGNTEVYHPSGTFLRIGETSGHEDLTGKDYDGIWKIARNTNKAVHVHLSVANGGAQVASIDIDPAGNITEQNNGNLTATVGGNTTATVGGNLSATVSGTTTVHSAGVMDLTAPTITLNGTIVLNGPLTQGKGSNGGKCVMMGPLEIVNDVVSQADVKAGAISLIGHSHSDPQGGTVGTPI